MLKVSRKPELRHLPCRPACRASVFMTVGHASFLRDAEVVVMLSVPAQQALENVDMTTLPALSRSTCRQGRSAADFQTRG